MKNITINITVFRNSKPEVFLRKGVLKIYSKFRGEHPCRSAISTKLQSNFTEIALWHGCSPVNLLHIFRTPFPKNISEWLLLIISRVQICYSYTELLIIHFDFRIYQDCEFIRVLNMPGLYKDLNNIFHDRCLTAFWICLGLWVCQGSNYARVTHDSE